MEVNNESFEELFKAEGSGKLQQIKPGQKITATIVGISEETTFLDVGSKSEGVLNSAELVDKEGNFIKKTGDRIEVYFLQTKGFEQLFAGRNGRECLYRKQCRFHWNDQCPRLRQRVFWKNVYWQ